MKKAKLTLLPLILLMSSCKGNNVNLDVAYYNKFRNTYIVFHENYYETSDYKQLCEYDGNKVYEIHFGDVESECAGEFKTSTTFVSSSEIEYKLYMKGEN